MEIKTYKLKGSALDYAVAKCEWVQWVFETATTAEIVHDCHYSTRWIQGGPILDAHEITIDYRENETIARKWSDTLNNFVEARAAKKQGLLAAMRCYVAFHLGDTVDIPEELVNELD